MSEVERPDLYERDDYGPFGRQADLTELVDRLEAVLSLEP